MIILDGIERILPNDSIEIHVNNPIILDGIESKLIDCDNIPLIIS